MNNQLKNRFQEGWSYQNKLITYYYLIFFFLRGLKIRFWIKSAKGLLLVGKNVRLFYPKNLQVGTATSVVSQVYSSATGKRYKDIGPAGGKY